MEGESIQKENIYIDKSTITKILQLKCAQISQVCGYRCCHLELSPNKVSSFLEYNLSKHLKACLLAMFLEPLASKSKWVGDLARPLPAPESMACKPFPSTPPGSQPQLEKDCELRVFWKRLSTYSIHMDCELDLNDTSQTALRRTDGWRP